RSARRRPEPDDERDHEAPGGAAGDPGQDLNAFAAAGRCTDAQTRAADAVVAATGALTARPLAPLGGVFASASLMKQFEPAPPSRTCTSWMTLFNGRFQWSNGSASYRADGGTGGSLALPGEGAILFGD